jgi:hypothetical protein
LYVEVPVAEIPKWIDCFVSLAIGDELRRLTTCNSATQTYPMVVDLPHLGILSIERQSAHSLDFKPEMGYARRSWPRTLNKTHSIGFQTPLLCIYTKGPKPKENTILQEFALTLGSMGDRVIPVML